MRAFVLSLALLVSLGIRAQDVLSMGSGSSQVPVTITKVTANSVQGVAFKILFDESEVSSMSFARTGAFAVATPLYESSQQGSGWFSYFVLFSSATNVSGQLGMLSATATAPAATVIALRFDAPSAMLSNQSASVVETVANGLLALSNGSITVPSSAAPTGLVATASGTTAIDVTWNAVGGATQYEVWRSVDGSAFSLVGSPVSTSLHDTSVVAGKTYLYRVRAVSGAFSTTDAATTIVFTDDPLVVQSTLVQAVHITELRTAVDAMRASGGLAALAADGTIGVGQLVRAAHITALRTGLDEARVAIGLSALTYTDAVPAIIKAAHVEELRSGVK